MGLFLCVKFFLEISGGVFKHPKYPSLVTALTVAMCYEYSVSHSVSIIFDVYDDACRKWRLFAPHKANGYYVDTVAWWLIIINN